MAVAKSFETKFVGFFSLGQELTQLFATEVNNALDSANFSELSRLKRSGDNFTQVLMDNLKTVSSMKVVLLTPLYAAFVFYPDIVIAVLLGNNWTEMAPYLQYFALAAYFTSFQTSYSNCLLVYREPKINFYVSVLNLILKVLVLVVAIFYKEPLLVAVGDVFIQISKMLFLQVALRLKSGIPLCEFNKLLPYDSVFVGVTILCYGLMSLIPNVAEIWKFIAAVSLIVVFILYLLCSQSNYYDYLRHLVKPVLMARIAMITQRFSR